MAWSFYAGHLGVGQSTRWRFWWGGNAYQGIQVTQARALPRREGEIGFIFPAELVMSEPSLTLELNGGYSYAVTVTNRGPWDAEYEIVGDSV